MAAPIISRNTSLTGCPQWGKFTFQPVLTQGAGEDDPDVTWTATPLPGGWTLDAATGKVSTTAAAENGIFDVVLTATNDDGSDKLTLTLQIPATRPTAGSDIDTVIDMISREVRQRVAPPVPSGASSPAATAVQPFAVALYGDDLLFRIALDKGGALADLAVTSFTVSLKEYDADAVICEGGGPTTTVGGIHYYKRDSDSGTYRVYMKLVDDRLLAALGNYEKDRGTSFDARLQFTLTYTNPDSTDFGPAAAVFTTNTALLRVVRPQKPTT